MATVSAIQSMDHLETFDWGTIKWLCSQAIDPDCEMTFGMVYISPGSSNPRHYHPNCEEYIYLVSGECMHSLGDETYRLTPGHMLRIPRGVAHHAEVYGWEPCRMMIMYSAPDRRTVGE